jgi:hypothetical protein
MGRSMLNRAARLRHTWHTGRLPVQACGRAVISADKTAATAAGVRLSDGTTLAAQLVVDCSGRGSHLPSWLAAAGYKRPRTTRATADAGYTAW